MAKNLRYFRKKSFKRKYILNSSYGLCHSKNSLKLILNKNERQTLNLFKKARKIKKIHNLKLLTGQSELKEVKTKSLANESSDFDDDVSLKDEKEVSFYFTILLIY